MKRILITGGCGFIGSNFVRMALNKHKGIHITNLDALTYAGNLKNLVDFESKSNYAFVKGDIRDGKLVSSLIKDGHFDLVVNFAAESHVDRSILDPSDFISTNIAGTQTVLNAAMTFQVPLFMQVSTDEVYGSLGSEGYFTETTPLAPNSPYSASKASADMLVRAYFHTYNYPTIITRCSNNYGPYQFPEKFIPLFVTNALENKPVPLYGDGKNVRDWIHVEDHCEALWTVAEKGKPGEVYNIGGNCERANVDIAREILRLTGRPESMIQFVKDRLGHDRRYAIDNAKIIKELGCKPKWNFTDGLKSTIEWYKKNTSWWQEIKSGEYKNYYAKQYGK